MTEFTGLDMEMTFKDDYHEVLDVIEETFLQVPRFTRGVEGVREGSQCLSFLAFLDHLPHPHVNTSLNLLFSTHPPPRHHFHPLSSLQIFEGLNARCASEIEAVRAQYPSAPLRFSRPALRMRFDEATTLLRTHGPRVGAKQLDALKRELEEAEEGGREAGKEAAKELRQLVVDMERHLEGVGSHGEEEDLSTRDEKLLGAVVAEVKGTDFYTIDKFPTALRPFYTMPDPRDPKWSNSYDVFIRGEEVTSGAQRIHDSEMLLANGARLGVDLKPIEDYVNSFKYGAHPHAGGGIGLERVVMLFLQLDNIRKTSMFPRDPNRLTP
ncbi:MAG: hypothetical protein SGPRY_002306 [Prymnesium sp.]